MDTVLDVAFVLAVTAFFKAQFNLEQGKALLAAFCVALAFSFAPQIAVYLPTAAPFIDGLLKTFTLFLGAAGSYDAIKSLTK